jgi:hypothetical protein
MPGMSDGGWCAVLRAPGQWVLTLAMTPDRKRIIRANLNHHSQHVRAHDALQLPN